MLLVGDPNQFGHGAFTFAQNDGIQGRVIPEGLSGTKGDVGTAHNRQDIRIDVFDVRYNRDGTVKCHGDGRNAGNKGLEFLYLALQHGPAVGENNQIKNFYLKSRLN
jgi:hypothetical protein